MLYKATKQVALHCGGDMLAIPARFHTFLPKVISKVISILTHSGGEPASLLRTGAERTLEANLAPL